MVDHVVEGHRNGGDLAGHHVRSGIADQNDVDTGLIDQSCQRVIVGGEHRDFFTCSLHLLKRVGGHFPCFAVDGHDSSTALGVFNASPASFFFVDQAEHVGLQFVKGFGSR